MPIGNRKVPIISIIALVYLKCSQEAEIRDIHITQKNKIA